MKKRMPAVLLASGSGSNLQTIIDQIAAGKLDVDLRLVLCNNPKAFALERAKKAGIPVWSASHKNYPNRAAFDLDVMKAIEEAGIKSNSPEIASGAQNGALIGKHSSSSQKTPQKASAETALATSPETSPGASLRASESGCVILAGYMRLLSDAFIEAYAGRIVNIHPAILPSFAGAHGGPDAIAYGVKISGCTVHFVDEIMDHGPIIIQAAVPHRAGEELDNLMQRIHALEHRIFPQALQWLAEDRLVQKGRVVHLLPPDNEVQAYGSQSNEPLNPWLVSPALESF